MQITRRDFLKDFAYAAALVGLPSWVSQLDEMPPAEMRMLSSSAYSWQWTPASDLGTGSPVLTALSRIAFGPRPGDFERVQQIGIDAYGEEQLSPEKIDDRVLEQRIAGSFPTLNKSIGELMRDYPQQPQRPAQNLSKGEQLERLLAGLGIKTELTQIPAEVVGQLQDATMMRASFSRRQLLEVLVDFWSTHFSIYAFKDEDRWMKTVDDRDVIRKKDVSELARVLMGWTTRPVRRNGAFGGLDYTDAGTFYFDPNRHDTGSKLVLGISFPGNGGINEGRRALDILAHHPSTAHFIAKKLVTRFVSDTPPDALVQRTAQTFTQTDGDLRAVLSTILHSDEFKNSFAQKIKRPFELVASAVRAVDLQADDVRILSTTLRLMGQGLFMRLTPDGYPDNGSVWINTGALLARWNFSMLLAGGQVPRATVDLDARFSCNTCHVSTSNTLPF